MNALLVHAPVLQRTSGVRSFSRGPARSDGTMESETPGDMIGGRRQGGKHLQLPNSAIQVGVGHGSDDVRVLLRNADDLRPEGREELINYINWLKHRRERTKAPTEKE
jgi:hypothetical protein